MKSYPHSTRFEFAFPFVLEVWELGVGSWELGVREFSYVRYAKFIGGIMDEIPSPLPQTHDDAKLMLNTG